VTATGQHISHYKILEKLGEGGMGVVYKAQDLKLNRAVALKFLPPGAVRSENDLKRLQQEAHALSSLNHPNIATIFDIDEAEGQRFIALEYLSGGTLRSQVRDLAGRGKLLPVDRIAAYGRQVASALAHAHANGIIHRDVKTENLMLTAEGAVKMTDFGLARLGEESTVTRTGSAVGTAAYMSPEQIRGEKIDERSDIFSFGVVLYEMTTGRLPFRGEHEAAVTYSILNSEPEDLSSVRQGIPRELKQLIEKCLVKESDRRYQTCEKILEDLKNIGGSGQPEAEQPSSRKPQKFSVIAAVAGALMILGGIGLLVIPQFSSGTTYVPPSVAVLYVENMTENTTFDSFAIGMTEEIINELANVPGLQVVSRSDVMPYQQKPVDVRQIGEKLGVSYVLESSVRSEGTKIRITCQAIQTADRFHFWSQAYTRELTSILDVQSDIARQVALGLKTKFAQKELEQKLGLPANSLLKEQRQP